MASFIDNFFKIFDIFFWVIKLRIKNHALSKLIVFVLIFISYSASFFCYRREMFAVNVKYYYWGEKIAARTNTEGIFNYYRKAYPFIRNLWAHLDNNILIQKQKYEVSLALKKNSTLEFEQSFKDFFNWVQENNWPTLIRISSELKPIIETKNHLNLYEIEEIFIQQDNRMKNVVAESTLDSNIKAKIFIRLRLLNEQLKKAIQIQIPPMASLNKYNHLKTIFRDAYIETRDRAILLQNDQINFYNQFKKIFLYFNLYLSIILLFRFGLRIHQTIKGRKIDFRKIKTSQLIIDLLFELEEVGRWLSSKDKFQISHEKKTGYIKIQFSVGGIDLDKHALHYSHKLTNGTQRSIHDILSEFKDRSVKFNCCNYYKENDEPHSFTITLEIKTSK